MTRLACVLLFALAFASTQASLTNDVENGVSDIEQALRKGYDEMINEIEYLAERLKRFFQGLIEKKRFEINSIAELAEQKVDQDPSMDDDCKESIKKQIDDHKTVHLGNFFSCSNLTDALVESGSVIVFSLELTANITSNFNAIFGRLSECNQDSFIKKPYCWFEAVLDLKGDIQSDLNDINYYKTKVTKLVSDISANIEYCASPPKANLKAAIDQVIASKDCKNAHH